MRSDLPPTLPIERLRWEHDRLLSQFDELIAHAERPLNGNSDKIQNKVNSTIKFLELHQESEERFLFPLVYELGETLFSGLREEHMLLLQSSDVLLSTLKSSKSDSLPHLLRIFKESLSEHFANEESNLFPNAVNVLTPAQVDILKIKFATRPIAVK